MRSDPSKYGKLKLVLDKYVFIPGELMTGTINLMLFKDFPQSSLIFHFKAIEEGIWVSINRVLITKTRYILKSWNSSIPSGDYAVNFEFLLPLNLPTTFDYFRMGLGDFKLLYKVYARLKSSTVKLGNKQTVGITNEVNAQYTLVDSTIQRITRCQILKGTLALSVIWINQIYSSGNPIHCMLNVDNSNSRISFKRVVASSYFTIVGTNLQGFKTFLKVNIFESSYRIKIPAGSKMIEDEAYSFEFDIRKLTKNNSTFKNVHHQESFIIECKFYIDFKFECDSKWLACCFNVPSITSMYFVKPDISIPLPAIYIPKDWNPQLLEPACFMYDLKNEANDKEKSIFFKRFKVYQD